jgi:hypothetical protein
MLLACCKALGSKILRTSVGKPDESCNELVTSHTAADLHASQLSQLHIQPKSTVLFSVPSARLLKISLEHLSRTN